ncbi:MAG: TetR/AcrR family transcriptional regulator [bacterium]|nr:TetR/AcrR family transcriptional regulator [bacterium]
MVDESGAASSGGTGRPAHRPSRRSEIVYAATNVFSRLTYAEATVEDIASECGVAPTAVYYHFGGKEELFDQAFESCLQGFSAMIDSVRASVDELNEVALREVIYAGWAWWRTHPVEARFLTLHLNGATPHSRRLYEAWQERHAQRAFDYLPEDERPPRSSRKAREQYAMRLLGFHFLGALLPISQSAWLDGSLSRLPVAKVESALADILMPIMMGASQPDPA